MAKDLLEKEEFAVKAEKATQKHLECKNCFWYDKCVFGKGSQTPFECCGCNGDVFFEGYIQALTDKNEGY